ncbi:hypothetical protein C0Q44_17450 [Paenibacillus sp. PCH8]|uniref:GerMN domain-containing protein n=1 Tax=Paenibacillus sp. PCH8 TaxID=2066524 RepID=UPI000CF97470|nr:GerMN domain-containing protein [Paenibacillus sp. PCH8]PQP81508.1 hypothetical protein C0Q44_17450 [Paenibacillus sp. PCH8]
MNKMKKYTSFMVMFGLCAIIIAGCGDKPVTNSGTTANPKDTVNSSSPNEQDQVIEQSEEIEVAYVDAQVTTVVKSKAEIKFSDSKDKYTKVFEALQSADDPNHVSLWNNIELKSLEFLDGTLTLDVHIPDEARLGSGGELLALDVLKETMFQFQEVNSLELLVDGAASESLMGHSELEHPMVRVTE